jgi:superfamily II DNA helicase RecQ
MPYWICRKCKLYIPATSHHKINKKCKCGGQLLWHDKIPQDTDEDYYYKEISPLMQQIIREYESSIARIILHCVSEVYVPVSNKILMLILQGNPTPFIQKHHLHELETYSMLSNYSQNNLLIILESLINLNLLKLEHQSRYSNKPVSNLTDEGLNYVSNLKLTAEGREFLNTEENVFLGFLDKLDILK